MNAKITFLKTVCVLILSVLFLSSCQKSTESANDSNDNGNGDNTVTPKIIDIKTNGDKAVYVTNTGYVYSVIIQSSPYGSTLVKSKVRGLKDIVKVGCGPFYTITAFGKWVALDKDGKIYIWDVNPLTGVADSAVVYTKMSSFTAKIVDIAIGGDNITFALALDVNHKVWAWGYNGFYQLGNTTSYIQETPAIVNGLPNDITAISTGARHSVALSSGGNVYHWGNIDTQLEEIYSTPTLVAGASPASAISAGFNYNLAKKSDGTVFAWGHLTDGIVPGITNPSVICAGSELYFNPMFIKSDGTLWKTSFSMATGNPTTAESAADLAAYRFSLISVFNRAFYVTQDGLVLAQLSTGSTPLVLNNPLQ